MRQSKRFKDNVNCEKQKGNKTCVIDHTWDKLTEMMMEFPTLLSSQESKKALKELQKHSNFKVSKKFLNLGQSGFHLTFLSQVS